MATSKKKKEEIKEKFDDPDKKKEKETQIKFHPIKK